MSLVIGTCGHEFTTKAKETTTCPECSKTVRFKKTQNNTEKHKKTQENTDKLQPTKYRLSALLRPYTIIIDLLVNHYDQTWYKGNKPKGNKALILFDNISRLSKILNIERRYFPEEGLK